MHGKLAGCPERQFEQSQRRFSRLISNLNTKDKRISLTEMPLYQVNIVSCFVLRVRRLTGQVEHNPWADGTWEPEALLEKASDMVLKAGGKWVYKSVYVLGFGYVSIKTEFPPRILN